MDDEHTGYDFRKSLSTKQLLSTFDRYMRVSTKIQKRKDARDRVLLDKKISPSEKLKLYRRYGKISKEEEEMASATWSIAYRTFLTGMDRDEFVDRMFRLVSRLGRPNAKVDVSEFVHADSNKRWDMRKEMSDQELVNLIHSLKPFVRLYPQEYSYDNDKTRWALRDLISEMTQRVYKKR